MGRWLRAGLVALAAAAFAALTSAHPAAAHVTVDPAEAVRGGFARLAFRVPNESDAAATVKVEVYLPTQHPVAFVSTMPVPGWTVAVERQKLDKPVAGGHGGEIIEAVNRITWTAGPGAAIAPGQFQEFPVSLGPLPDVDRLVFKALQTYSDGTIARWIEEPGADGSEPANPAPTLKLIAPPASAGSGAARPGGEGSGWALPAAVAGLVFGVAGLAAGVLALVRTRRPGPRTD
jgi:uncharacterized protein YcnI